LKNYIEKTLGTEAIDYLQYHLSIGHSLSRCVLNNIDLKAGQLTTGLPENADFGRLYDFKYGGILPQIPKNEWAKYHNSENKTYVIPKKQYFEFIIDNIYSFINKGSGRLCIFENANAGSTDPALEKFQSKVFFLKGEVYHVLDNGSYTRNDIEKCIRETQSGWNFIGILTSISSDSAIPANRQEISPDLLENLCKNTEKIIVGAYDEEAFLLWHKSD
jgi:hypothetical protein